MFNSMKPAQFSLRRSETPTNFQRTLESGAVRDRAPKTGSKTNKEDTSSQFAKFIQPLAQGARMRPRRLGEGQV